MTEISAKDVKALRDRTGAGMMDCKRALQETGGDIEAAVELLRVQLGNKIGKLAGRGCNGRPRRARRLGARGRGSRRRDGDRTRHGGSPQ